MHEFEEEIHADARYVTARQVYGAIIRQDRPDVTIALILKALDDWYAKGLKHGDCVWQLHAKYYFTYVNEWKTGCGEAWILEKDGTPENEGMIFCPICGGKIMLEKSK